MAYATGNYVSDNSSLANFQSWTTAIYNAFVTTCGWSQTSDTGQAANPIAAVPSSAYVYWIFKSTDSLSSTMPIYVKVELGYSSTSPRIRMTVGTNSSGAGVISGVVCSGIPWEITNYEANLSTNIYPCFFSGDGGNFRMYMWQSVTTNCAVMFGIERSKNSSGADTADYVTVLTTQSSSSVSNSRQQTFSASLAYPIETAIVAWGPTGGTGTGYANGTIAVYPMFPLYGKVGNPMLGFCSGCSNDAGDGALVSVTSFYGGTHTFIVANKGNISYNIGQRASLSTALNLLMRYE